MEIAGTKHYILYLKQPNTFYHITSHITCIKAKEMKKHVYKVTGDNVSNAWITLLLCQYHRRKSEIKLINKNVYTRIIDTILYNEN